MNTLVLLIGSLCVFALGYRYYSAFLAAKVLVLNDKRLTPAHTYADGQNYVPSPKFVLFRHHFAAIAGAGPLIGPTLAGAVRLCPWFFVDRHRRCACRMRSRLYDSGCIDTAQRPLAARYRAD